MWMAAKSGPILWAVLMSVKQPRRAHPGEARTSRLTTNVGRSARRDRDHRAERASPALFRKNSSVQQIEWGVTITLSSSSSGLSCPTGSTSKTSSGGACDALLGERGVERLLVHDQASRAVLMKYAVGFINENSRAPMKPRVSGVSGVLTQTKSDSRNTVSLSVRRTQPRRVFRLRVRVVRQVHHLERRERAEQLAADVADADRPDRLAGQPDAHVVGRLAQRPVRVERVLGRELVRQREDQREDARRDGPTHAVGRVGEHDAVLGAVPSRRRCRSPTPMRATILHAARSGPETTAAAAPSD